MSRNYSDSTNDDFSIIPPENESAPKTKREESGAQTGDELMPKYIEEGIATDPNVDIGVNVGVIKEPQPQYDEAALLAFLRKIQPVALRELIPTSAYMYLEKKETSNHLELSSTFETDSNFTVAAMTCNCFGSTIAVGLIATDHFGFCQHQSAIHFLSTVSTTRHSINIDSCVTALKYHPHYPAILAIGHHTGELSVIRNEEKWGHTQLGETHTTRIVAIDWLSERQTVSAIVTASVEGLICIWNLKGRNSKTNVFEQYQQVKVSETNGSISCMTVIPGSSDAFVGLESGMIVRIPLPFESSYVAREKQYYTGQTGPVSAISICPVAPGLFVSVGTDESLCIRNINVNEPLNVALVFGTALLDASWSTKSPSVVAVVSNEKIAIMDFCISSTEPVMVLEAPNARKCFWSDAIPGTLYVGCTNGKVLVFSCSGAFEQHPSANRLMSQWEAQTKIVLSK